MVEKTIVFCGKFCIKKGWSHGESGKHVEKFVARGEIQDLIRLGICLEELSP